MNPPQTKTQGGITYTRNLDSSYSITGTRTGGSWIGLYEGILPDYFQNGKYYTISLENNNNTKLKIAFYEYSDTSFANSITSYNTDSSEVVVYIDPNCKSIMVRLVVFSGATTVDERVYVKIINELAYNIYFSTTAKTYEKSDNDGAYYDLNDFTNPGTFILETSIRKENQPDVDLSFNALEVSKYSSISPRFLVQKLFNITNTSIYNIDNTCYVRYKQLNTWTSWIKCPSILDSEDTFNSLKNYNSYDILFRYLIKLSNREQTINGITYVIDDEGKITSSGTTTANSFLHVYQGPLPDVMKPNTTLSTKMQSTSGNVTLRIYFYDENWTDATRVAYFISEDRDINVPNMAKNLIIWYGIDVEENPITVDESSKPAILTRSASGGNTNYNTYNYTVHNDTYNVTATPQITSTSDLYLASTGTTADRTSDIMALLQSQKVCKLGVGDFYISTGISMPDKTSLIGSGRGTRLILDPNVTNGYVVSVGSYCSVQDMIITGKIDGDLPYEDFTIGTRDGIVQLGDATGFNGSSTFTHNYDKLSNLWIENFTGSGIKSYRNDGAASFLATNIDIFHCGVGVNIELFSEFHAWNNIRTRWCVYGCIMNGGNNLFSNCHFDTCITQLSINNSENNLVNDSHSSFTNCTFCHANNNTGTAIEIINVKNGLCFSNSQIFYGKTIIQNSHGVIISNFNFGNAEQISITGSRGINISNCIFGSAPTIVNTDNSGIIWQNNMTRTGNVIQLS